MRKLAALSVVLVAIGASTLAEERVDEGVVAKIKAEAFQRSQVMETLSWLTDVHGPRLTNSPGYAAAAEWARQRMAAWGLSNARLEPWGTFGPGWSVDRFSVEMTAPSYARLIAYPLAWTRSTQGTVTGTPVLVEIAEKEDLAKYKGKLRGAIVMLNKPKAPVSRFTARASRFTGDELTAMGSAMQPGAPESLEAESAEWKKESELEDATAAFLKDEQIGVLLEPSVRDELGVEAASVSYYIDTGPWFPAFVLAKEHYGRLMRLLEKKIPVTLEIALRTTFHDKDTRGYNVLAEIPGSDPKLAPELVMLGGHLDSWHTGTGATDNASGCAVVLEAVRILQAVGAKPRRTVRVALWGGEEQDYYGSRGYVAARVGDIKTGAAGPEHGLISGYFNVDNGSGRIRGVHLQGNEGVRPIFESWLRPFAYLGATTLTVRNTGGTDHMLFNAAGVPGFQFLQDPLDYDTQTHHTDLDVYESVVPEDLQQASAIVASFVYHAAMRDEKLPRKPRPGPKS